MSQPQNKPRDIFKETILPDLSPFKLVSTETEPVSKTSREGQPYTTYLLQIKPTRSDRSFTVEAFQRSAERLRVLSLLSPDKAIVAVFKMKKNPDDYDEVIFAYEGDSIS